MDMFSNMWSAVSPINLLSISIEYSSTFLFFSFAKQEDGEIMTSHLIDDWLEVLVSSNQIGNKNKKVLQKLRKLDILQALFNYGIYFLSI